MRPMHPAAVGIVFLLLVMGLAPAYAPAWEAAGPGSSESGSPSPAPASAPVFATFPVSGDAFIDSGNPDRNYGGSDSLAVGRNPTNGNVYRSALQFPVTGIPPPAVILNATLRVHVSTASTGQVIDAHRIRAPWVEGSASEFGFRNAITVTETAGVARVREPIVLLFIVPVPLSTFVPADFRVFDDLGIEIPSQVYGAQYAGPDVTRIRVVFGATVGALGTRVYHLYYGNLLSLVPAFRTKSLGSTPLWTFNAGTRYTPLAAADLNGDGRLEVILGSSDRNLYAIQWNGTELWRFTAPDVIDFFAAVVDVNGDGSLDIVFMTGPTDHRLWAISGNGAQVLWTTGPVPTKETQAAVAIADVDGDGIKELFVGSTDRYLYAFNGSTGAVRWSFRLPAGGWGYSAAVDDLVDGPGREIVYTTSLGNYYIMRPDGTIRSTWSVTSRSAQVTPSIGDFDRDGNLDIASGDTAVNGNQFAFRATDGSVIYNRATSSDQYGGQILVDFEDDGWLETAFSLTESNSIGGLGILDRNGTYRWPPFFTAGSVWGGPIAADVNLDGVEDILVGSFDRSLYIVDSTGAQIARFLAPDEVSALPIVADLDGDGTMEIVFSSRSRTYAYGTGSLGHDYRTSGYNHRLTGRFLDGNSPDGVARLQATVGAAETLGGSGVTWRTRDGASAWASPGSDYDASVGPTSTVTANGQWLSWNVTSIVQSWTNGSAPNAGFLLKSSNEAASEATTFVSRDGAPALRAVLEVLYLANTSPRIASTVPNQQAMEDGPLWTLDLLGFAQDPDTPVTRLKWDLAGVNNSLYEYSGGNVTGNHRLQFLPKPNAWGTNRATLFLFDDQGNYAWQRLWINITPVNDAPLFKPPPPTTLYVKYGTPYTFDFSPYITDIDTPMSQLRLRTDRPTYTSVSGFRVTFTYPANHPDQWDFVVLTVDDGELSDSESIAIRLTTDTPPELRTPLPDVTLNEGETRLNVFDLDDYFFDPDNDTLFFSYGFTHLTVTIRTGVPQPALNIVDIQALGEWWGTESVTFRATDPTGALIEDTILVTVLPVNDPPVLAWTPPYVVRYDEPYVFDLRPYISDPDNDISEITITTSLPNNITVQGTVMTMLFPYTYSTFPLVQAPYTLSLTIFASDGLDTAFRVTTVTVGNDYPPQLKPGVQLPDVTFFEDEILANAFDLDDYFEDRDSPTIFYYSGPINIQVFISSATHMVNFTARQDWFGFEPVTFRATDEFGAYAEDTIKVTVRAVNDAPYFLTLPALTSNERTFFFDVRDYVEDVDTEKSDLRISTSNPYVQVQGSILIFSYPDESTVDSVNLTVSDGLASTTAILEVRIQRPGLLVTLLPWIVAMAAAIAFVFVTRAFRNVVEHVFLIYQGGTPLVHLSRTLTSDKDPDLIASMFTAIQSFMNESFHSMGVGDVQSIEMADHHVAFGRGEFVLLVVLYRGRESNRLERRVQGVVNDIERKYRHVLIDWNGDVDRLDGVKKLLEQLWGAKDTGQFLRSLRTPEPPPPADPPLLR